MLASDVAALGSHATEYMVVPEYQIVELHKDDIKVFDLKGKEQKTEFLEIDWDTSRDGKGKYPFYMEKEIMEQPEALQATLDHRIVDGHIDLSQFNASWHILIIRSFTFEFSCMVYLRRNSSVSAPFNI